MQVDTGTVTASIVIVIWSAVQSFALEYLWFVSPWFDKLEPKQKKTINAAGVFLIVLIAYLLSVFDVVNAFTPDLAGAFTAVGVFFGALGIGTGVHLATKATNNKPPTS